MKANANPSLPPLPAAACLLPTTACASTVIPERLRRAKYVEPNHWRVHSVTTYTDGWQQITYRVGKDRFTFKNLRPDGVEETEQEWEEFLISLVEWKEGKELW